MTAILRRTVILLAALNLSYFGVEFTVALLVPGIATLWTAWRKFVHSLLAEERPEAAQDAHMRFRRTGYGDSSDGEFGPQPRTMTAKIQGGPDHIALPLKRGPHNRRQSKREPVTHTIASLPLSRLRTPRLKKCHVELVSAGLSKASANRTLSTLKAALNLAVRHRIVSATAAQEWAEAGPLKCASRRRELFLDVTQRRALLAKSEGAVRRLMEAVMHTGCRAGELTSARRSAFDPRTKSLSVTGKTGTLTLPHFLDGSALEIRCF
jgi:hypothetical protein